MNPVVLDLETVGMDEQDILARLPEWCPDEARTRVPKNYKAALAIAEWMEADRLTYVSKAVEKAALTPEFATIAVIGFWKNGVVEQLTCGSDLIPDLSPNVVQYSSEADMIVDAFRHLTGISSQTPPEVVGWNLFGMDLYFLVRRAWILGLTVPSAIYNPTARYPYPERFTCLMEVYRAGRRDEKYTSLDNALKALGLPPKTGSGKDFPRLWQTDRKAALAYSANDCVVEAEIGKRMGVIRTPEPAIPVMTKMDMEETLP